MKNDSSGGTTISAIGDVSFYNVSPSTLKMRIWVDSSPILSVAQHVKHKLIAVLYYDNGTGPIITVAKPPDTPIECTEYGWLLSL